MEQRTESELLIEHRQHLQNTIDDILDEPKENIRSVSISVTCDAKTITFILNEDDVDSFEKIFIALKAEATKKIKTINKNIKKALSEE